MSPSAGSDSAVSADLDTARRSRFAAVALEERLQGARVDVLVVAALVVLALALRVAYLGPPSLWVDDAWVTLVTKTHGLSQFRVVAQTAPGFAAMLKGWLALVGFSETKGQILPLVFGVVTPVVAYLAFLRLGIGRVGAAVGALLLVVSPILIIESVRVKQFTLDCLCSLVVLVLSMRLLDDVGSRRRWWTVALAGVGAVVMSGPSSVFLACGLGVALLRLWRERQRLAVAYGPIAVAGAATLAWWAIVLRPANNATLRHFWDGYFFVFGSPSYTASRAGRIARDFFSAALPMSAYAGALLIVLAFAVVLRRRPYLGLLLVSPLAVAVVLAALRYAPLGSGRTDIYLYPALALAVASAVDEIRAGGTRWALALVGVVCAWAIVSTATADHSYPKENVKPMVAKAESVVPSSEAILVYHDTNFAFALYTTWPIAFEKTNDQPMGFEAPVQRPNVFTLLPRDRHPQAYNEVLDRLLRSYHTVWLAASHTQYRPGDFAYLEGLLRARRLAPTRTYAWDGAQLARWSPR